MKDNNFMDELSETLNSILHKSEIEKRKGGSNEMLSKLMWMKGLKFLILLLFFFFSCNSDAPKKTSPSEESTIKISVPQFNADSAFYYVKKQVEFGPRISNSPAHDKCAEYLISQLKSRGLKITEQRGVVVAWDGKKLNFNNITAQYQPEKLNRVLISAHWDSRPWADNDIKNTDKPIDAANDGASGVGVILELARLLSTQKLTIGVDFVLFDAEDYGKPHAENSYCLGSQYWAQNFSFSSKPLYGINLDMVGDPSAKFTYEGVSMQTARGVLDKVWKSAHTQGYANYFVAEESSPITDDHLYVNKYTGIPCIDIIDRSTSSFAPTWHTHNDNLQNISLQTLKAVGQTLTLVLVTE